VNPHLTFFWIPAILLLVAGALLLLLPGKAADPLNRRNRRTAGVLMLAAGAIFAGVAGGVLDRLL
jgi:drug/metabolite transporter (DMT)-like permease